MLDRASEKGRRSLLLAAQTLRARRRFTRFDQNWPLATSAPPSDTQLDGSAAQRAVPASQRGSERERAGIVGETDINPQDVADFRTFFGLAASPINVIHNGPPPGILAGRRRDGIFIRSSMVRCSREGCDYRLRCERVDREQLGCGSLGPVHRRPQSCAHHERELWRV